MVFFCVPLSLLFFIYYLFFLYWCLVHVIYTFDVSLLLDFIYIYIYIYILNKEESRYILRKRYQKDKPENI